MKRIIVMVSIAGMFPACGAMNDSHLKANSEENAKVYTIQESIGDKALIAKINTLTSEEEKAIDSAQFLDLLTQFETIVAYNAAKSSDPKWDEVQKKLIDNRETLQKLAKAFPTVGDMRKAAGAQNYKGLNVAPWQSDLDAFPIDIMYPEQSAQSFRGRALLAVNPIMAQCVGSVVLGAAGFVIGIIGELGTNAGGITHNPADRNVFAWLGAGMLQASIAGFIMGGC